MKNKSIGTPLFEATLTFTLPDGVGVDFPALWGPTGSVIPQFSAEEFEVVGQKLQALGEDIPLTATITLIEDSSVHADIDWDDKRGFIPVGESLAQWVRAKYPDDCAYLDEVRYPATMFWKFSDGRVLRMPAYWLNTGEVLPRPRGTLLRTIMQRRDAVMPGGILGHIVLRADPSIASEVRLDEEHSMVGPSKAFQDWVLASK